MEESRAAGVQEGCDIGTLLSRARAFKDTLRAVKARLATPDLEWYPYDSLANLSHLDRLLTGANRSILESAREGTVADIGSQDGDLSFFLESAGFRVQALDCPETNHNHMRGIRAISAALGSSVEIHEVDLDSQFYLPAKAYEVTFLLGVLYHLKNPFYVLETLARQSRYCFLSTRIAALTPDGSTSLAELPVAWLVGDSELNSDDSAYWIFSETGLRRMLDRAQWDIVEYLSIGDTGQSDPLHRDERCFCLLRSRAGLLGRGLTSVNLDLCAGWHEPEDRGWRWTKQRFSARASREGLNLSRLRLKVFVPAALLDDSDTVTLRFWANSRELPAETFRSPGDVELVRTFDPVQHVNVEFELDRALPPDHADPRERGLVVGVLKFE